MALLSASSPRHALAHSASVEAPPDRGALAAPANAPQAILARLALFEGENSVRASVLDAANGFAYFGTCTSPGRVIKVRLSDFTRVGAVQLDAGENYLISSAIDPAGGYAYFATDTTPGRIVRIRLDPFARDGALTLNSGEYEPIVAAIDLAGALSMTGRRPARPPVSPGYTWRIVGKAECVIDV